MKKGRITWNANNRDLKLLSTYFAIELMRQPTKYKVFIPFLQSVPGLVDRKLNAGSSS